MKKLQLNSSKFPLFDGKKRFLVMTVGFLTSLLLTAGYSLAFPNLSGLDRVNAATSEKVFVGYFESWSETSASTPEQLQLANIAPYVNMVMVSFMKPDGIYNKGSYDLSTTGLNFTAGGRVVKDAIALLKQRNPRTKVLLSVGGATYTNFAQLNPTAIANVVADFGFDGVDIDYEPDNNAVCSSVGEKISCSSDAEFRRVVSQIRQVLPKPYLITVAAWSIGAYGEGQWANSQPQGQKTGLLLNLLRSPEAAAIDQLNVMSYDAGSTYNPQEALAAYQNYFSGKVVMGVEVPPEAWGGHVYTIPEVQSLGQAVVNKNAAGLMLWSLQKQPQGTPSDNNPTAEAIAKTSCQILSLGNCEQPLFSTGLPTPPPTPQSNLKTQTIITSDWDTGFCSKLSVTNQGTTSVENWRLKFQLKQAVIESTWNATFTPSSGNASEYIVTPDDWIKVIAVNQTREVGFCANKTGNDYKPQNVTAEQL
ncbi:cellulose binding domain-containing protein [Scytonema sp. NUACC26]|uniref:cellulose binding domain-containing protein n=1 Tax=Scytonema sp. NUACC26 TaxID=3140176 RepID=UPI0034DBD6EE